MTKFLWWVLVVNVINLGVIFRVRSFPEPDADFQTYLKLFIWTLSIIVSLVFWRTWIVKSVRLDNLFFCFFIIFCGISAFYAPLLYFSAGAVYSIVAIMMFVAAVTSLLNEEEVLSGIFVGLSVICLISIPAYFINPEFARLGEWHGSEYIIGPRMSGVTGSANALGATSAFGVLLAIYMLHKGYFRSKVLLLLFLAIDFYCLIMTNSRTSLIAVLVAVAVMPLVRPDLAKYIFYAYMFVAFGIVLSAALFFAPEELASSFSRSGDVEEITSGTGRTAIWAVTLDLIEKNFIFGYGYASSLQLFDEQAEKIGFKVASAHNMILQIILSTGIIGLLLFFVACLLKVYTALASGSSLVVALFVFLMILGLSESVAVQGTANVSSLILALLFFAPYTHRYDKSS